MYLFTKHSSGDRPGMNPVRWNCCCLRLTVSFICFCFTAGTRLPCSLRHHPHRMPGQTNICTVMVNNKSYSCVSFLQLWKCEIQFCNLCIVLIFQRPVCQFVHCCFSPAGFLWFHSDHTMFSFASGLWRGRWSFSCIDFNYLMCHVKISTLFQSWWPAVNSSGDTN